MTMPAPGALLLAFLASAAPPRPESVDEPVADVAAFYLESCAGVPARERRSCESGVAQNRARIGAALYLAHVDLGRFYAVRGQRSVFRTVPYNAAAGGAAVDLNFVLGAEPMAEAPDACLALQEAGHGDCWHRLDAPMNGAEASAWLKRVDQLLARSPAPAMNVEVLFRVRSTGRVGAIGPCAIGEPLLIRLLDGETGEVLAMYQSASLPRGVVPERPMHAALSATGGGDPRSTYLAAVRGQIARNLPPRTGAAAHEVTMRVVIGEDGTVVKDLVERSSGDSRIDRLVADAVRRASPLPAPPAPLRREMKEGGVLVEFHP